MKTVIIPARSCETGIKLFNLTAQLYRSEPVNVWFLEIRPMPDNYNDLMTLGRTPVKQGVFDAAFYDTIRGLTNGDNSRISFQIDHIYGDSPFVFRNYAQFREANLVVYDKQEWQNSKKETGLNIFRMAIRSNCELMYVSESTNLLQKEPPAENKKPIQSVPNTYAPASVLYQFKEVDTRLNDLEQSLYEKQVVSKSMNNLSRYFLSEAILEKQLLQSDCSLLLLKK